MPLKILFVAAEVAPFRKTGGLGDVVGALPKALAARGIDARVVMPLYQGLPWDDFDILDGVLEVPVGHGTARGRARAGRLPGSDVPVYFLEHHHYFDRPGIYADPAGGWYTDNLERFVFLSRGALELTRALDWVPDVAHANDWHTALVPVYLNTVEWGRPLHGTASVFTIHNLAYQGNDGPEAMAVTGLGADHFNQDEFEHFGQFNPLKAALRHSTMLCTVSPSYARMIQTSDYGCGLDGVLAARAADLRPILNGIDVTEWDPAADPHLAAGFTADDRSGKAVCKAALQRELGLPERPDVPLLGVVSRLTGQKGLDVLALALDRLLETDLQLAVLGTGEPDTEAAFAGWAARRGDRVGCVIGFDDALAHRIEAGADFFVMPSRFEPCGLNQMYSQRYGTLPIVRATGGLADTVEPYQPGGLGTGFAFTDLSVDALVGTITAAVALFHDRPDEISAMRERAMRRDFSWAGAAAEHERLYLDAYARRRGHAFAGSST